MGMERVRRLGYSAKDPAQEYLAVRVVSFPIMDGKKFEGLF